MARNRGPEVKGWVTTCIVVSEIPDSLIPLQVRGGGPFLPPLILGRVVRWEGQ